MARGTGTVLLLAVVLAACRRAPSDDDATIRKRLSQKSTAVLLQEVAKAEFKPPADGHLTEPEIRSYLKLEERSRRIRAVASQGAAPELGATADLRAAQELGLNPKEMAWVRDRIREARTARLTERLDHRIADSRLAYIRRLQAEEAQTTDPARKKDLERRIADFSRAPQGSGQSAPSWIRWNAELLGRYEETGKQQ
ncbi:MAG TPA: hypothetical protein VH988_16115 [Thermoanaerobaculia bacterium]|jgi:hypothetical protein|nr:hypothetical protein [Thermoanaerobaculia bacterium]